MVRVVVAVLVPCPSVVVVGVFPVGGCILLVFVVVVVLGFVFLINVTVVGCVVVVVALLRLVRVCQYLATQ